MYRRAGISVVALAWAAACGIWNAAFAAAPPGSGAAPSRHAILLASHGEPLLAWDALRAGGPARTDADAALAVRLLTELGRYAQAESLLARETAPASDAGSSWYYLRRARLSLDAGRADRALELLDASRPSANDPMGAYAEFVRAQALQKKGDANAAALALDRASVSAPEALATPLAAERVRVLRALGRSQDALAAIGTGIEHSEDGAERRRMLLDRFDIAREAGDRAVATDAALVLLEEHRAYPEAETCALEVTRPLRAADASEALSTRMLFACAGTFATRHRTDDLRRTLRVLDARALKGSDEERLRLFWAEFHYEDGDYSRAIALARPSYSEPAYKRRSTILLARSFRAVGRKADAAAVYEEFANAFPNDALAADALYAAAALRQENGQPAENARLLDQLRRSYPSSFHGWAAAMRRANELRAGGDVDQAAEIFEQWLARSRRTDEAALFYLSQLYATDQSKGNSQMLLDELRRVNPYSFYVSPDVGRLVRGPVRDAMGNTAMTGPGSLSTWLSGAATERERAYERVTAAATSQGDDTVEDAQTRQSLERGRRFLEAGFRDWAQRELDVVRRQPRMSPELALVLAKTYEEYAMPWRSVRVFDRARIALQWEARTQLANDFRFLMYPLPYPAQVFDASARNQIPPHLIYAIMREESRFESDVVSRAGAVGLMQLMPETARRVARRLELGDVGDRLDDPSVNVSIGSWYASDLLREGDGSVAWMLAAYNAGPGAAKRWLEPGVAGDAAITAVESIDYRETRGYVKRVVESANVYHSLYFGAPLAPISPR